MRGPGGFDAGKVSDALVSQVDVYPTICELAGIEAPDWLQGVSLLPLVQGRAQEVRREVYAEVTYHAAYEPQRAVRTRRWKYIRRFDEEMTTPILPNCDESEAKDVWLAHGWRDRPVEGEQLYDVVFDPNESRNLAGDSRFERTLVKMRTRLQRWMEDTDDPLLTGPVPAPRGASVNDRRDASPGDPPLVVE